MARKQVLEITGLIVVHFNKSYASILFCTTAAYRLDDLSSILGKNKENGRASS
jgi:hypothetical protein